MARIVMHIHSLAGGGAERVWAVLASGLARRGHEIFMAVEKSEDANRCFLNEKVKLMLLKATSHTRQVAEFATLWKQVEPQLVLTAGASTMLKVACARNLLSTDFAFLISVHGAVATGLLGRTGLMLFPAIARTADHIVYNSNGMRGLVERQWLVPRTRACVIHNPVWLPPAGDPGICEQLIPALANRRFVLSVGRLQTSQKAQDDLLSAFARFAESHPSFDLVIVGDGPSRAALEALAARLGIQRRVHFAGYQREPWSFYAGAAVFAHTARSEAFGNVIVEALGFGLPIVATDTLGAQEVLAKGKFGCVVPIGDIEAIRRGLSNLAKSRIDPSVQRRRAAEFAPDRAVQQYEDLIERILTERDGHLGGQLRKKRCLPNPAVRSSRKSFDASRSITRRAFR